MTRSEAKWFASGVLQGWLIDIGDQKIVQWEYDRLHARVADAVWRVANTRIKVLKEDDDCGRVPVSLKRNGRKASLV